MRSLNSIIAQRVILMIREQIEAGKDIDGKTYQYSSKPFARPLGGKYYAKIKTHIKKGNVKVFKRRKSKWAIFTGGYKQYREIIGRSSSTDFLDVSGKMLGSLAYKVTESDISIVFRNEESSNLAYYLNIAGAGKSKKLWKFLGLNKANQEALKNEVAELYTAQALKLIELDFKKFINQ